MTLQQLRCFAATARHGSFNAAARALRLSQPAVSEQVRALEAELGATLVHRATRGVGLTADGERLLAHAERVLGAAEDAATSVGRRADPPPATLTLGWTRNAPYHPVEELVARVAAEVPGVRLRFPGQNSAGVADAVRRGTLEAALVVLPVDPDGLQVRPLFRDEILFATTDPARVRRPVPIRAALRGPLVLYDASHAAVDPTRRQLAARAQEAGLALDVRYDVEHLETAARLAARGLADTFVPRSAAARPGFPADLHTGRLTEPLYDHVTLVTRAGPPPTGAMARLVELVTAWGDALHETPPER